MTYDEYIQALEEKHVLERAIKEYEENCCRGCLRVVEVKMGYKRKKDGYSLQLETGNLLGLERINWHTVFSSEDAEKVLSVLKGISDSAECAYDAFADKVKTTIHLKKQEVPLTKEGKEDVVVNFIPIEDFYGISGLSPEARAIIQDSFDKKYFRYTTDIINLYNNSPHDNLFDFFLSQDGASKETAQELAEAFDRIRFN